MGTKHLSFASSFLTATLSLLWSWKLNSSPFLQQQFLRISNCRRRTCNQQDVAAARDCCGTRGTWLSKVNKGATSAADLSTGGGWEDVPLFSINPSKSGANEALWCWLSPAPRPEDCPEETWAAAAIGRHPLGSAGMILTLRHFDSNEQRKW